ncbi:NHLP leader peptide family RiPP precursor [Xanthobacter flavus]|uniref:NHLP leader peptide family RiPP precursor n=1 Tax=Xanthobacter flavus TaxID=281 RepID=UPI00372C9F4B
MTKTTTEPKSTTPDVIVRAASDPDFRARLLQDATATLAELGIVLPPEVTVKVVENTPSVVHLVLPALATEELTEGQLDQVAGGTSGENLDSASELLRTLMKEHNDTQMNIIKNI